MLGRLEYDDDRTDDHSINERVRTVIIEMNHQRGDEQYGNKVGSEQQQCISSVICAEY